MVLALAAVALTLVVGVVVLVRRRRPEDAHVSQSWLDEHHRHR